MKKITTLFYISAVLALFILLTGCSHSKKESGTGETADNDAVDADIYDGDDADSEDSEPDADDPDADQTDVATDGDDDRSDNDSEPAEERCVTIDDNLWSPRAPDQMDCQNAMEYCSSLDKCGFNDWRLPTVSELRTLIQNCPNTETGGNCETEDSCLDHGECWKWQDCYSDFCSSEGDYSKLGDKGWFWSSSDYRTPFVMLEEWSNNSYGVNFSNATLIKNSCSLKSSVRCIRKIDGFDENAGCSVVDGNMWSLKRSAYLMSQNGVIDSCENLTECGFSDWHLPAIDELRTLIRNCDGTVTGGECGVGDECLSSKDCWTENTCSSCPYNGIGKYSKLGDRGTLWSFSANPDSSSNGWVVNFFYGSILSRSADLETEYHYRCVRKYSDDEKGDEGCMSGRDKCVNFQSLHCEDGYWIPEEYCESAYNCDPLTGKCYEAECVPGKYSCWEGNPSKESKYCKRGHWKRRTCEEGCEPSTGKCSDVCHNVDGRMWSPIAVETLDDAEMNWENALNYCENLTACGYDDWHLPTISELRTLIQNCPDIETGGACKISDNCTERDCYEAGVFCYPNSCNYDSSGKYSKIGDIKYFWSSSAVSDSNNHAWEINFASAIISQHSKNETDYVRCVR